MPRLNADHPPASSSIRALGWALFLGMSWTWCIGMFLPVLLVRDYGVAGWLVFAAPNVVGAAAMGWFIRSGQSSREIVSAHSTACAAFSIVTVLFHLFFITWFVERLIGHQFLPVVGLVLVPVLLSVRRGKLNFLLAGLALMVSISAFAVMLAHAPAREAAAAELSRRDLIFLGPVCLFGFALCPYLDLTFHRARYSTEGAAAKIAFGMGFGFFFLSMIVLTLWYAPYLPRWIVAGVRLEKSVFTYALGFHMLVQALLTISFHVSELVRHQRFSDNRVVIPLAVVVMAVCVLGLGINEAERVRPRVYHGIEYGEVVYRVFMGFYGLVFPAYVWLCMIPSPAQAPASRSGLAFGIATLLAMPFFWTGFIESRMMWLLPGVFLILFARLCISSVPGKALRRAQHV
ncbi:MAG TPA: hypothetical protein VF669_11375, partial [Tepidisphaeraceae bacterium]